MTKEEEFKMDNGIYGTYEIDKEGLCNVEGTVDLSKRDLKEIPIRFGVVQGSFWCYDNQLTSLKNAPIKVTGCFDCCNNKLTSLEFAPKEIGRSFWIHSNNLTTLRYAPKYVGGELTCNDNAVRFTKEAVKSVCKVGYGIYV